MPRNLEPHFGGPGYGADTVLFPNEALRLLAMIRSGA
jgi:hypothetical protein